MKVVVDSMAWLSPYLSAVITIISVLKDVNVTGSYCLCYHQCCGMYCGKVLLCLILLSVFSCTNSEMKDKRKCRRGTILPRYPYFVEGEDINLICNRRRGSSKHLTFVRGQKSEEVPKRYIKRLNDTAIQLKIPNVTAGDIDATAYEQQYRCVNKKDHSKCFDSVFVKLEYMVREPINLQCWDYNFNEMKCTWSHEVDYHRPNFFEVTCDFRTDKTELEYTTFGGKWMRCEDLTNESCYWDAANYPAPESDIDVRVSVTDTRRNVTKTISKTFNKYDIVVPGPVTRLRKQLNSSNPRCVQLQWKPPVPTRSFEFMLTYFSNCSGQQEKTVFYYDENSNSIDNVEICNLVPRTDYNFSVKGRIIRKSNNGTYVGWGHWSKSASIKVKTGKDVPDISPILSPGLYELSNNTGQWSDEDLYSLQFFWDPLEECHWHDEPGNVNYVVSVNNRSTRLRHSDFMAEINVPKQKVYNVTLQAANSVGPALALRTYMIYNPLMYGLKHSELIILDNKTSTSCVRYAEILVKETNPDYTDLHHTLVWCEGTNFCKKALVWEQLENRTSFEFPGHVCNASYRYGLVTHGLYKGQGLNVDTGIQWETCIYQLGKVLDTVVKNVKVVSQRAKSFDVEWTPYDCKTTNTYVSQYMLTYCKKGGQHNCTCDKDKVDKNISKERSTYSSDTDLEAGSIYCVIIRGKYKAGQGPVYSHSVLVKDGSTTLSLTLGLIIGTVCLVILGLAPFCCRYLYKYCQKIKEKLTVRIPEMENDINSLTLNNVRGSGPEYINNTSAGTEMTNLDDRLTVAEDEEDNMDGYKDPNDVDAVESGYQDESLSSHGMRSAGFGKESHLVSENEITNESLINNDTNTIDVTSEPDPVVRRFNSHVNTSIEDDGDGVEMQPLLSKYESANETDYQESDDAISLNELIEQDEQSDDIYKVIHSGSTIDESYEEQIEIKLNEDEEQSENEINKDKEQNETELKEDNLSGNKLIEESISYDIHLQTPLNDIEIDKDISDSFDEKVSDKNQTCPLAVISLSAISDHSDHEQTFAANMHKSNFTPSELDDSDTDLESMTGIMNERDDPEIGGYKQTEDVEEQSEFESESDRENDSEIEADGYKQAGEVSGTEVEEDVGGYKNPDEVSGMSGSESEVEDTDEDRNNSEDFKELSVKFDKQDEILKKNGITMTDLIKNGTIKNGIIENGVITKGFIKNGITRNGFISKLSETDKVRTNSLSDSDNSITSATSSSHGNSSSAVSYVKAGEDIDSKEEKKDQPLKGDLKGTIDKKGVKSQELTDSLLSQENCL